MLAPRHDPQVVFEAAVPPLADARKEAPGVTLEEARRFALSLPEVSEEPHFEKVSWRVRGKIFATAHPSGEQLNIFVEKVHARAIAANLPDSFAELHWGIRLAGVTARLAAADEDIVCGLLEQAWRRKAPKRQVAALDKAPAE
jgi:hypothetical protein